ncbi:ubiquitination network signaling protein, partial [Metarhizium majus ARSEF 297]
MPRASGPGKRQQGASSGHRDSKHDNGLVSPAKRNAGRKSHGHQLDGSARPPDHSAGHAGPSPSPPLLPLHATAHPHASSSKSNSDAAIDTRTADFTRRGSLGTFSETSSDSCPSQAGANGNAPIEPGHRQIDLNAMKNVDVHKDSGPLEMAVTVVKSLPMQDTLAILIILMHVPHLSLSLIYAFFALVTFVPPVTTRTGMNINLAEILDSHSHTLNFVTLLCIDFFFFLIWVFLWQPIQDGILEFAKPVIAITLGGGTNAKDGTSRGVTTCFTWILLHQIIRATRSHWAKLARHLPENWPLPTLLTQSLEPRSVAYDKRSTHGWIQSILAMHILTQGIVRYVREWYLKREKYNAASGLSDPEAGKSSSLGNSSGSLGGGHQNSSQSLESSNDAGLAGADAEASVLHPPTSTNLTTTKKRRKQNAQVRLQQPLWAAVASTKIVVMKEMELSKSVRPDGIVNIHTNEGTTFEKKDRQIWISYIGSDEVCFNTSYFSDSKTDIPQEPMKSNGHVKTTRPSGVDSSKPFYVRINNAFWQPTRIFPIDEVDEDDEDKDGKRGKRIRWTGDIYGLRPASKYVCEFVDVETGAVIFSTSIRTVKELLREDDPLSPVFPPSQQPLRPDSPATILRTSIAASEAKLAEEKSRLRTLRKDLKIKINAVRKENELVDNQLSSAGNSDEKHRQKIRQQETQKAQAERDTESLTGELKNFDTAPELSERKKKMERTYAAEKKTFDAEQKEFKKHKSSLDAEVKTKELEMSNLNTRRNKIATRISRVETELNHITDANNRGLGEAERRNQQRALWLSHAASIEHNISERLTVVHGNNRAKMRQYQLLQDQTQAYSVYLNSANGMPGDDGPTSGAQPATWNPNPVVAPNYPPGMWPGSSSDLIPPVAAPSTHVSAPGWQPPPSAPPFEPRGARSRGRSSSMLSDLSGFTEPSDEGSVKSPPIILRRPGPGLLGRNGRSGGSSASSGSASFGDPASPR